VFKTPIKIAGPGTVQFEAGLLRKNYTDPAEEDILDGNIKVVYRLFIP